MSRVSIVVPAYNCEKTINNCIHSLLSQTLKDIEIIIVDDGSTDSTSVLCDSLANEDKRITVIHQKNGGAGKARNVGLLKCSSEYVGFVDSDDVVDADMFAKLYSVGKEQELSIVRCNTISIYGEKRQEKCWSPDYCNIVLDSDFIKKRVIPDMIAPEEEKNYKQRLLRGCACCIFEYKMLKENNILFRDIRNGQDAVFTIECMWHANKMSTIDDYLYFYNRSDSNSLSISKAKLRNYNLRNTIRKCILSLVNGTDYFDIYKKRFEQEDRRYVFLDLRIATIFNHDDTFCQKLSLVKEIVNSSESREAFSGYSPKGLPFQLKTLYSLIYHRQAFLLLLVMLLKYRKK